MATDKQIRIGVDPSAAKDFQEKMRMISEQMAEGLLRDARKYTTSAKEVNEFLKERIKLQRESIELDKGMRQSIASEKFESGKTSKGQFEREKAGIDKDYREEKLQTKILQDILAKIEKNSKDENRERRIDVEKRIQASKTVDQLDPKGDIEEHYKETLQQEYLQSLRDKEDEQRGGGSAAGVGRYGMIPANALGTRDAVDAVSKASMGAGGMLRGMGTGGIVGAVIALTVGAVARELGEANINVEQAQKEYLKYFGGTSRGMGSRVRGIYESDVYRYGMSPSDVLGQMAELRGAAKTNIIEDPYAAMAVYNTTNISKSQIGQAMSLRKYGS